MKSTSATGPGWAGRRCEDRFKFASHEWLDQIQRQGAPNGESGKVFRASASSLACARSSPGIAVKMSPIFCHGGVIRMMLAILLKLPLPKTNQFDIEYAGVTQVALHPHMAEIELMNFTPWRDLVG